MGGGSRLHGGMMAHCRQFIALAVPVGYRLQAANCPRDEVDCNGGVAQAVPAIESEYLHTVGASWFRQEYARSSKRKDKVT